MVAVVLMMVIGMERRRKTTATGLVRTAADAAVAAIATIAVGGSAADVAAGATVDAGQGVPGILSEFVALASFVGCPSSSSVSLAFGILVPSPVATLRKDADDPRFLARRPPGPVLLELVVAGHDGFARKLDNDPDEAVQARVDEQAAL